MKHTKGKWESEGTTVFALHQKGWDKGKPRMSNRFYAGVYGDVCGPNPVTMDEIYGNAKLISKCPEMYEALKDLQERVIRCRKLLQEHNGDGWNILDTKESESLIKEIES